MSASPIADVEKDDRASAAGIALDVLYDNHAEYIARRDPLSFEARQILLEVVTFKIPHLLSVIPDGFNYRSISEVGCATGELIASYPEYGPDGDVLEKYGFDISPSNIKEAKNRYRNVTFSDAQFYDGPAVDVVVLSDILEHVPDDVDFLRRAGESASLVLVNLPLEDNWLNLRRPYGFSDKSGHLRRYTEEAGRALVVRAGLRIVSCVRVWSHETSYDVERRMLREQLLGSQYSGTWPVRCLKTLVHGLARGCRPFGRRLYPSNLIMSAARVDQTR
ncbi:MAG: class I SAM-dependent methyltransferase [Chromatiales bacterium]|nr:class I SAM-dependent methyltransferase [Chromatiales bacterium]